MNIAIAGIGYVGLSLADLLSQQNKVTAVDIVPDKVQMLNDWKSPIKDEYIKKYLEEHESRSLDLCATTDGNTAYASVDYVIVAVPTNYDPQKNYFDTSAVENVIDLQMPLLPLKTIEMKNQSDEVEMKQGDTLRVDTIGLSGLNERKSPYYGFNKDFGKWVLIDGSGKELTDGSIAKLTRNAVTGNVTLTAAAPGTVYLKYLIDENKYGILSHPGIYAKNADLAKTAMIEIRIKGADAAVPTEAKPVTELTLPRNAVSPENPVSSKTNEKAVFAAKKDKDTKGSTFSLLQAKGAPKSKSSIKLSWKKVPGAKNYIIYGSPCGGGIKKITTVKGTSYTQKKLNKGKYYKYVIAAVNGGNTLATSKTIHVATKGGKVGNNTGVKLSKKKVTLKPGTSAKVTAKLKAGELKVNIHRKIAWESGNISIATVKNGKIKGVKPGTCYVFAYAQNGVTAKIKVTVT